MPFIRLGQFTDSYPPVINGVSTFVAEHHAELLARGEDAHIFTFGYLKHQDDQKNVWRSFAIPMGTSQFRTWPGLNPRSYRAAAGLDVLHLHEALGIGLQGRALAEQKQIPYVFTCHTRNDLYIRNYPRLAQPLLLSYVTHTTARFIRGSALTTVPSHDSMRWLQSIAPDASDRIRVVHNGVLIDVLDRSSGQPDRGALGLGPDQTVFIYVGRVTPEKNLKILAEAMVRAVNAGADLHWLVIGDGASRRQIETIVAPIKSHVSFLGELPHADIPHYLTLADVFITTSLSEVNPVSVIEALACQKPYIGLKAAWWDEFADDDTDDQAGLLCDHNPIDLAATIQRVCEDRTLRAQMSAQAAHISHNFDIHNVTAKWIEIYRSVADTVEIGKDDRPASPLRRFFGLPSSHPALDERKNTR